MRTEESVQQRLSGKEMGKRWTRYDREREEGKGIWAGVPLIADRTAIGRQVR